MGEQCEQTFLCTRYTNANKQVKLLSVTTSQKNINHSFLELSISDAEVGSTNSLVDLSSLKFFQMSLASELVKRIAITSVDTILPIIQSPYRTKSREGVYELGLSLAEASIFSWYICTPGFMAWRFNLGLPPPP